MTTSWKSLVTELETLTKNNGRAAWRTAQIVRDLFKDKEYLADACGNMLDDMVSKLAKYSGRFALGVNDMIQMIEHFPKEKDWETGRLDLLRDKTCQKLGGRSGRGKDAANRTRKVITRAEYEALKRKYEALQVKAKEQAAEIERLHKQLGRFATKA